MEFKEVSLEEVVDKYIDNRGKTCPTVEKNEEYLPLIATNCITDRMYPELIKTRSIDKETYNNWFRDHPKEGDIIFVNKGTPGKTALVPPNVNFCFAQDMIGLRIKSSYDNKYIFAVLRSKQLRYKIDNMHVGTLIPHFKKNDFKNLKFKIIKDPEIQKHIGTFYYSLLRKIECNYAIIKSLEQISQTLFKRWFIDFEFPNEEGQPYKSSGGKMVDSELGEIPEGWEIKKLGTIVSNKREKYKKEEKLPYVPINELPMKKMLFYNFLPAEQAKSSLIKFNKNDILIGNMRVYFHRVCLAPFEGVTRTTTFVLKPLTSLFRNYILLNLFTEKFVDFANQTSKGTTIPYAVWENGCENFKVIFPNDESILKKFNDVVDETILKSLLLLEEIDKLEQLRDTLLPKLLSGEIEIPDDLEV